MRGLTLDGVGVITYRTNLPEPTVDRPSDAGGGRGRRVFVDRIFTPTKAGNVAFTR